MENILNKKVSLGEIFSGDKKTYAEGGEITDKIKTFEDAVKATGEKEKFSTNDTKDEIAYKKLKIIAKALNEGWTPGWDSKEYKYYPYFDMRSGFGFEYTHYVTWASHTAFGSRLCFKSSELAEYAGKQFEAIYRDFMTL